MRTDYWRLNVYPDDQPRPPITINGRIGPFWCEQDKLPYHPTGWWPYTVYGKGRQSIPPYDFTATSVMATTRGYPEARLITSLLNGLWHTVKDSQLGAESAEVKVIDEKI